MWVRTRVPWEAWRRGVARTIRRRQNRRRTRVDLRNLSQHDPWNRHVRGPPGLGGQSSASLWENVP